MTISDCEKVTRRLNEAGVMMADFDESLSFGADKIFQSKVKKVSLREIATRAKEECYEAGSFIFWKKYKDGEVVLETLVVFDDETGVEHGKFEPTSEMWLAHPDGIMLVRGWQISVNGKILLDFNYLKTNNYPSYLNASFNVFTHPKGFMLQFQDRIYINGELVYTEPFLSQKSVFPHPKGFVIHRDGKFYLNGKELLIDISYNPITEKNERIPWTDSTVDGKGNVYLQFFKVKKNGNRQIFDTYWLKNGQKEGMVTTYNTDLIEAKGHQDGGVIILDEERGRVLLNGKTLLYQKDGLRSLEDVEPYPGGVIVREGNTWTFHNGDRYRQKVMKKWFWQRENK